MIFKGVTFSLYNMLNVALRLVKNKIGQTDHSLNIFE